jgi:hypothetical protein
MHFIPALLNGVRIGSTPECEGGNSQSFARFPVHLELFTAWLSSLAELGQGGLAGKLSSG